MSRKMKLQIHVKDPKFLKFRNVLKVLLGLLSTSSLFSYSSFFGTLMINFSQYFLYQVQRSRSFMQLKSFLTFSFFLALLSIFFFQPFKELALLCFSSTFFLLNFQLFLYTVIILINLDLELRPN